MERERGGDWRLLRAASEDGRRGTSEKVLSAWTAMKLRRRDKSFSAEAVGEAGPVWPSWSSSDWTSVAAAAAAAAALTALLLLKSDRGLGPGAGCGVGPVAGFDAETPPTPSHDLANEVAEDEGEDNADAWLPDGRSVLSLALLAQMVRAGPVPCSPSFPEQDLASGA